MKEKQLVPVNDRVLVKPISQKEHKVGNILVADLGRERPEMGEVLAVGSGRVTEFGTFIKPNVKPGDIILVPKIGSLRIEFEGEEFYIVPDKEILCVVKVSEIN